MAQLRLDYKKFIENETQIIVVGPEDAKSYKEYWQSNDLPFIGLPDHKASILKLYGQEINLFKFGRMPAQVLIDRTGTARFVHYGHSMSDIPKNEEVLALIDEINH
jgi:peroxiredoxin